MNRSIALIAAAITLAAVLSSSQAATAAPSSPLLWSGCWKGGAADGSWVDQFHLNITDTEWPASGVVYFNGTWLRVKGDYTGINGTIDQGRLVRDTGEVHFVSHYPPSPWGHSVVTWISLDGISVKEMQWCPSRTGEDACQTPWIDIVGDRDCRAPSPTPSSPQLWAGCWEGGVSGWINQYVLNIAATEWPQSGIVHFTGKWSQVRGPHFGVSGIIDNGTLTRDTGEVYFYTRYLTGDSIVNWFSLDGGVANKMKFCNTYSGGDACQSPWIDLTGDHQCQAVAVKSAVVPSPFSSLLRRIRDPRPHALPPPV